MEALNEKYLEERTRADSLTRGRIVRPLRQRIWILFMLSFLSAFFGCATSNLRSVNQELGPIEHCLSDDAGCRITGYVLSNGDRVDYNGWARIAGPDSIEFWSEYTVDDMSESGSVETIRVDGPTFALASVRVLDVVVGSAGKTGLAIIGVLVGLVVLMAIAYSGPF